MATTSRGIERNGENVGTLKAAIEKVNSENDSFQNDFMLLDMKAIRNRYTDANLHEGLANFARNLKFHSLGI